jgi:hypothetical protein
VAETVGGGKFARKRLGRGSLCRVRM